MANNDNHRVRALLIFLLLLVVFGATYWFLGRSKNHDSVKSVEELWREQNVAENPEGIDRNLAPDFTLDSINKEKVTISDYRDKKAIILSFWTTWCPDCKDVLLEEQKLYSEHKDRVEVLAVNIGEEDAVVERFVADNKLEFPVLLDKESNVLSLYGVDYANMHILITKGGKIARVVFGEITKDNFEELASR